MSSTLTDSRLTDSRRGTYVDLIYVTEPWESGVLEPSDGGTYYKIVHEDVTYRTWYNRDVHRPEEGHWHVHTVGPNGFSVLAPWFRGTDSATLQLLLAASETGRYVSRGRRRR